MQQNACFSAHGKIWYKSGEVCWRTVTNKLLSLKDPLLTSYKFALLKVFMVSEERLVPKYGDAKCRLGKGSNLQYWAKLACCQTLIGHWSRTSPHLLKCLLIPQCFQSNYLFQHSQVSISKTRHILGHIIIIMTKKSAKKQLMLYSKRNGKTED